MRYEEPEKNDAELEFMLFSNGQQGKQVDKNVIIQRFNGYVPEHDINSRGREVVLHEVANIRKEMDTIDLKDLTSEGLGLAEKIAPGKKFDKPPVYFIYAGRMTNAKIVDNAIVINLGNVLRGSGDQEDKALLIKSLLAHEGVHLFLRDLNPPRNTGNELLEILWEEGLATFIEPVHMKVHEGYVAEAESIWWPALKGYLKAESDPGRIDIIERCLRQSETMSEHREEVATKVREMVEQGDAQRAFGTMMVNANGPIYHLGFQMWQEMTRQRPLDMLVSDGSIWVSDYLSQK